MASDEPKVGHTYRPRSDVDNRLPGLTVVSCNAFAVLLVKCYQTEVHALTMPRWWLGEFRDLGPEPWFDEQSKRNMAKEDHD